MLIHLADPSVVLLIGPSGSGKSTFARRHFRSTEILSSDFCRALVSDDENDQSATSDAFELLHLILSKRLARRRTTVIDATNVQSESRTTIVKAAKQHNVSLLAIVFMLSEDVCQHRNMKRSHRRVPGDVIRQQLAALAESTDHLESEGFDSIYRLRSEIEADSVSVFRPPSASV